MIRFKSKLIILTFHSCNNLDSLDSHKSIFQESNKFFFLIYFQERIS